MVTASTVFLYYFVLVTSGGSVTAERKQAIQVDATHTRYDFIQQIKIST